MPKQSYNSENSGFYGIAVGLSLVFTLAAIAVVWVELHQDYGVF